MRRMPRTWTAVLLVVGLIGVALLALVGLSGCAGSEGEASGPKTLRVGTWKTAQTAAPFFYEDHIDAPWVPEVSPFTNPGDQKAALLAKSLDFTGTTLALAIASVSRGEPVVVVSALCDKCSALVVGADSDIRAVEDLAGKKIGYVPGTMHEVLLRETLTKAGLDPDADAELVSVDFFDMGTALARGSIDAFLSGEPLPSQTVVDGYGRILAYPYYGESIGGINAGMIATRDMIDSDPALVQAAVTAQARSTEYLEAHPDEWLDYAAGFGVDRAVLDVAKDNIELTWDIDDAYIGRAKALGQRMLALGMIEQEPDWEALFDTTFVQEAAKDLE